MLRHVNYISSELFFVIKNKKQQNKNKNLGGHGSKGNTFKNTLE